MRADHDHAPFDAVEQEATAEDADSAVAFPCQAGYEWDRDRLVVDTAQLTPEQTVGTVRAAIATRSHHAPVRLLVLTGSMGAGKTTVMAEAYADVTPISEAPPDSLCRRAVRASRRSQTRPR